MKRRYELTLRDVAILLDGVEVPDETAARLAPFLRQDSRLEQEIAELELLAQDAGLNAEQSERLTTAYDIDQGFRRLLTTADWERPDEILDPEVGFNIGELLSIAAARLARSPNRVLMEIKEKLESATIEKRAAEQLVEVFLEGLGRLSGKQADVVMAETERRYRSHRAGQDQP